MPPDLGARPLFLLILASLAGCAAFDNRTAFSIDDPPWLSPRNQPLFRPTGPEPGAAPIDPTAPGSAPGAPAEPAAPAPIISPDSSTAPGSVSPDLPEGPQLMPIEPDSGIEPSSGIKPREEPPGPRLDLEVEAPSGRKVGAGTTFKLTIRNTGTAAAEDIAVDCEFDDAFLFPGRDEKRVRQTLAALPPGQASHIALTLYSQQEGRHCCRFSVTVKGVEAVWKSVCVDYSTNQLDVSIIGPPQRTIGSRAEFTIRLMNPSQTTIDQVTARLAYDSELLSVREGTEGAAREPGRLSWNVGRLGPGEGVQLQAELECLRPSPQTDVALEVAGGSLPTENRRVRLTIAPDSSDVQVQIEEPSDLVRVGDQLEYVITATNQGREPARAVRVAGRLPSNLALVSARAECSDAKTPLHRTGQAGIQFANAAVLPPGQSIRFRIVAKAVQSGDGWVAASVRHGPTGASSTLYEPTTVVE